LASVPDTDRGEYFQKLRAGYRIRREFFNFSVSLVTKANEAREVADVLRLLGFKVKY
jgi:hypothetical protein